MKIKSIIINLLLTPALFILLFGCSSRIDDPAVEHSATIVYPAKQADDIYAEINLCRRIDNKTGKLSGEGAVFSLIENGVMYAVINLENQHKHVNTGLMFHCDWIGPDGKSLFCKKIEIASGDSISSINSSISISPEKREAGNYFVKLYYFRELIAEKQFSLLPELIVTPQGIDKLAPKISLYRAVNKKTGKLIGEGTEFKMKAGRKVRANIELKNRYAFGEQELDFHIEWHGPEGESFFRKRYDLFPGDTSTTIKSAISISPKKRQAGEYKVLLLLFNTPIAAQTFILK